MHTIHSAPAFPVVQRRASRVLTAVLAAMLASGFWVFPGSISPVNATGAQAPSAGDLLINEVVSDPESGGTEWVEIYNASSETVSLEGLVVEQGITPASPSLLSEWELPVTMANFIGTPKNLGQATGATDGIDGSLNEVELPPPPFPSVTDYWFVIDSKPVTRDLRSNDDEVTNLTYTVRFQAGDAEYPVTFTWDPNLLPDDVTGSVQDIVTGSIASADIHDGSITIENTGITDITFTLTRNPATAERSIKYATFEELSGELAAGEYVVVSGSGINNDGDAVRLVSGTTVIDQMAFGNADDGDESDNAPVPTQGNSIARLPNGADTGIDSDDFYEMNPSQGAANVALGAITLDPSHTDESVPYEVLRATYSRHVAGATTYTVKNADTQKVYFQTQSSSEAISSEGAVEWSYRDETITIAIVSEDDVVSEDDSVLTSDDTIVPAGTNIVLTIAITPEGGTTETVTANYTVTEEDVLNADHDSTNDDLGVNTVATDKAALVDDLIKGENSNLSNITGALTDPLPSSGSNGSTITWESSDSAVVSNDGQNVNRPAFGQGNASVTLTATITKDDASDTKSFTLTVLEAEEEEEEEPAPAISAGDIIINEILPSPASGSEWVELYNTTDSDITLDGMLVEQATSPSQGVAFSAWQASLTMAGFDGTSKSFGQATGATDDIDAALGEVELPPAPQSDIRDFRFWINDTTPLTDDIRSTDSVSVSYIVDFQAGIAGYPVTFTWNTEELPDDADVTVLDAEGASVSADIASGSVTIEDQTIARIQIVIQRGPGGAQFSYSTFASLSGTLPAGGYVAITGSNLNDPGDSVRLVNGETVLDQVSYGNAADGDTSDNAPVPGSGLSIARIPNGANTGIASNDFDESAPTQAAENIAEEEEEEPAPAISAGDIVINEIFSNPASGSEWVELYNTTNEAITLDGMVVEQAASPSQDTAFSAWQTPLTMVGFDGTSKSFGQATGATDDLDAALGEVELPPAPFASVRDFRFVVGDDVPATKDLRSTDEQAVSFVVEFQAGSGYPVAFTWDSTTLPADAQLTVAAANGASIVVNEGSAVISDETVSAITFSVSRGPGGAQFSYSTFASLSGTLSAGGYLAVTGSGLDDAGDSVRLLNGSTVLDQVSYGNAADGDTSDNAPAPGQKYSISRFPDGTDSDAPDVDFHQTRPSQGSANNPQESAVATVTSGDYAVNNSTAVISGVPRQTDKEAFLAALDKGEENQTWDDSGVSDPVASGDTITVTAQDTIAQKIYTIAVLAATQSVPDAGTGAAAASQDAPEVVLTDSGQAITISVDTATENPTINVSAFVNAGEATLPQITITASNAGNTSVAIPASTRVTSSNPAWNGVIAAPKITTVALPPTEGTTKTVSVAIEVGVEDEALSFDKAVRLLLAGQAGKRAGYARTGTAFTEITTACSSDTQAAGDALPADGDCTIDAGDDLVIWTKHFTSFAAYTQTNNASTGGGGGGGGTAFSSPSTPTQFQTFDPVTGELTVGQPAAETPAAVEETLEQEPEEDAAQALAPQVLGAREYADGTLIRTPDKKIFVSENGRLRHIATLAELAASYRGKPITDIAASIAAYSDGDLIRAQDDPKVYVIANGARRHVPSLEDLARDHFGKPIHNVARAILLQY